MKAVKWWYVILFVSVVFTAMWAIMYYAEKHLNQESSNKDVDSPSLAYNDNGGTVGYIIKTDTSIYFYHAKDLPNANVSRDKFSSLQSSKDHPSNYVLIGEPLHDIENELTTGDKVEIWYSEVLESHPAKINVQKINILDTEAH